jgi:large repetitive protein
VTIVDNDAAPSLAVKDTSTTEGNSGTHQMLFRVQLSKASAKTITVKFTTADGSAKSPSDYYTRTGSLTFTPGQTVKDVYVDVRGDKKKEASEAMFLKIDSATNATLADSNGSGIIRNDD